MSTELRFRSPYPARWRGQTRSLWLEQAFGDEPAGAAPPLAGSTTADVCIVGGGFTGLWTALALKEQAPELDVVVLEGGDCGAGASGRNGGFVMSWWSKFSTLEKLHGRERALRFAGASADAVTAIGEFCAANGIDAQYHREGWVWTATNTAQLGAWESTIAATQAAGSDPFQPLTSAETAERSHSPAHLGGVFEPSCATVHPGRLVRGLARVARERGVRVFEHSPVHRIGRGAVPEVTTGGGTVRAPRVVLAVNAWAAQLPEFRRTMVVVASDVIATPPIPERLAAIGWDDGVAVSDSRRLVNYYRRTDDARIVFGKGGGTLAFSGRIGASFGRPSPRAGEVAAQLHLCYPMLADVVPERSWRGPIDYSLSGLPSFVRVAGRPDVIAAAGFSGNGVGPSYVAGRILAAMVRGEESDWADPRPSKALCRRLPPEPLRFAGGIAVRAAIARKERAEDAGRSPGAMTLRVAALDPTSFVDRGAPADGGHAEIPEEGA